MKEKIYIKDFFGLLVFYKRPLAIIMITSILCLVQLSFILPKTYRSSFEVNIYSKYFKNALINDVIPGMTSIPEMVQTTDSMIKETLNDQLIDDIGNQFHLYDSKKSNPKDLAKEREQLRNRFELFSSGGQSYRVSFSHGDPIVTFEVTKKVLEAVRSTFINTRIETIENAKKTIQQKLESANVTKHITDNSISANALASKNPKVLKSEILKIDSDLSALKMQFNINHPDIVKLQQRRATIENWLKEIDSDTRTNSPKGNTDLDAKEYSDTPLLMSSDNTIAQNITAKLYAKFNDINIALEIERKSLPGYIGIIEAPQIPTEPLFPKKRIFGSLGIIIGLVFCFGYVFYNEVMQLTASEKAKLMAHNLKSEYFGTMPHIGEVGLMTNKEIEWQEYSLVDDKSTQTRMKLEKSENT